MHGWQVSASDSEVAQVLTLWADARLSPNSEAVPSIILTRPISSASAQPDPAWLPSVLRDIQVGLETGCHLDHGSHRFCTEYNCHTNGDQLLDGGLRGVSGPRPASLAHSRLGLTAERPIDRLDDPQWGFRLDHGLQRHDAPGTASIEMDSLRMLYQIRW